MIYPVFVFEPAFRRIRHEHRASDAIVRAGAGRDRGRSAAQHAAAVDQQDVAGDEVGAEEVEEGAGDVRG